jgi:hypothetical protein
MDVSFGLGEVFVGCEVQEGVDVVGGRRVFFVEIFDGSLGMFEVGLGFPSVFFISKAFPLH